MHKHRRPPKNVDPLFKDMPPDVQRLHKLGRKELRLKRRDEWADKHLNLNSSNDPTTAKDLR
jgi:hypothetical protein